MILFNALQKSISAGIGRYSFELSKELYFQLKDDIKIIIREEDIKDYEFVNSKSLIIFRNIKNSRDRNLFEQIYIPKLISEKYKGSIVHYPDSMSPLFLNSKKIVITVHDLAFKTLTGVFTKKTLVWKNVMTNFSVKKANKIISITNFTKNELLRYYAGIEKKVNVVYNGFNNLSDSNICDKNISDKILKLTVCKYILTVSTISPRKNIDTLIKAFNEIDNKQNIKLVIVGGNGWMYESIHDLVCELNISNIVVFTGKVNDDELKFLYKNATVFVYPSLYEGFGLPPLEAMSYGVRTIVSDVTCLREVLGDSLEYFPPKDYKYLSAILNKIFKLEKQNESYNYDYVLNKYSWEKCANETIKVYNEIMKGV